MVELRIVSNKTQREPNADGIHVCIFESSQLECRGLTVKKYSICGG